MMTRAAKNTGGSSARTDCQNARMLIPRGETFGVGAVVEDVERPARDRPAGAGDMPNRNRRPRQVARVFEGRPQPNDVLAGAAAAVALGVEEGPAGRLFLFDSRRVHMRKAPTQLQEAVAH